MNIKTFFSTLLHSPENKARAMRFVILLGIVSLFADMTYEGARSISGAYLATLGLSAAAVGIIAGASELVGYALRLVFGYLADRTRQYWLLILSGYAINLLAVPLLALADNWWLAACLIVLQRFGKAVRTPARDTLLAQGGQQMGMGWAFGLHQALDQTGSMLGPLIVGIVLHFNGSYQAGFASLAVPALAALWVLVMARELYPKPDIENNKPTIFSTHKLWNRTFVLYLIGVGLIAVGYADFALISYHFEKTQLLGREWIPIVYGAAMGINILMAPLMGRVFDKVGIWAIIIISGVCAIFAPLVFLGSPIEAVIGVLLWGVSMGTQSALLRAAVADMVSEDKRGTAYGIFNVVYGLCLFMGSAAIGFLYDISLVWMVIFILAAEIIALPWLIAIAHKKE